MFALADSFEYFECENCGTLQIKEIPQNISAYYPANYYSFYSKTTTKERIINAIRDRFLYVGFPKFLLEKINQKIPNLSLSALLKVTKDKSTKILDVGCGEGKFLQSLFQLGFKNIKGIDPFIKETTNNPFAIEKKALEAIEEKFKIITFHHVLEHIEKVNETLKKCHTLLEEKGIVIIRVPVKDSFAYKNYGENWVQWDAPRHFQLLTKKAIGTLAKNNNFLVQDYYGDGYKFQFTGSEKYKRGFSYHTNNNSLFSKHQLKEFTQKAMQLNQEGKADQVVVVLLKS